MRAAHRQRQKTLSEADRRALDAVFAAHPLWHAAEDEPPPPPIGSPTRRSRRWPRRLGLALLALLVLAGAGAGYLDWQAHQIVGQFRAGSKLKIVQAALPALSTPPLHERTLPGLKGSMTFLLIGADVRYGQGGVGRSDTMILVQVNPAKRTVSLLSLPRDLWVDIPGYGYHKLNAAYAYGGPALLIKTLKSYLGVNINHFAQVDMPGFQQVVNDLGGVYLPIDGRYYHVNDGTVAGNWSSIDLQPGYQLLDGAQALSWVRFRHLDSDFVRTARQQIFLRTVEQQIKSQLGDVLNYPQLLTVVKDIARATTSDIGSLSTTISLAQTLRSIPSQDIYRATISAQGQWEPDGEDAEVATPQELATALEQWSDPTAHHTSATQITQAGGTGSAGIGDAAGARLTPNEPDTAVLAQEASKTGLDVCTPTELPEGYQWPGFSGSQEEIRAYKLNGDEAIAAWATAGSGDSVLWMWTSWSAPPILAGPHRTVTVPGGRTYRIYTEDGGKTRMVAWTQKGTTAWVTNTLQDALSPHQMLALAKTCK